MTIRLLVITINTGLWTAVFSVAEFALVWRVLFWFRILTRCSTAC